MASAGAIGEATSATIHLLASKTHCNSSSTERGTTSPKSTTARVLSMYDNIDESDYYRNPEDGTYHTTFSDSIADNYIRSQVRGASDSDDSCGRDCESSSSEVQYSFTNLPKTSEIPSYSRPSDSNADGINCVSYKRNYSADEPVMRSTSKRSSGSDVFDGIEDGMILSGDDDKQVDQRMEIIRSGRRHSSRRSLNDLESESSDGSVGLRETEQEVCVDSIYPV